MLASIFLAIFLPSLCTALTTSDPILTSWKKANGSTLTLNSVAYKSDITGIYYSSSYVYIKSEGIPSYSIGPWSNPNTPKGQSYTFQIPASPSAAVNKQDISTTLGSIGVWSHGMVIYNAYDGYVYSSVWHRNAYVFEVSSFDSCWGHPDVSGVYHNHVPVICMTTLTNSAAHSPIIGYAFDGYPIYGPYGYTNKSDSTSAIKRMIPSYSTVLFTNSQRRNLANGTSLSATYYGPDVNATYPVGSFLEDYAYTSGLGDLDDCNGRYGKTPEYPNGVYAYFTTVSANFTPVYPFVIGPYYYGSGSISRNGAVSVPTDVTTYFSSGATFSSVITSFSILATFLTVVKLF